MAAEYIVRRSPWRMALLLAGSLVFVALGAWIAGLLGTAPPDAPAWAGWLSILFFGATAGVIATRVFDSGAVLRINAEGLWWRDHADIVIPWTAIAAVGEYRLSNQRMIALQLLNPAAYPASGIAGMLASANRSLTGADVVITLSGTDGRIDEAIAAIVKHRR